MYHLQVLTPEQIFFNDQVIALIAPGSEGYLGILTSHIPLITALKTGVLIITDQHKKRLFYEVSGGFLEVSHNEAFVLVDTIQSTSAHYMGGEI